jgi:hypothetical protein
VLCLWLILFHCKYIAVGQLKFFVFICKTDESKPVKQEVNGTVILSPLVFPGWDDQHIAQWFRSIIDYCSYEIFSTLIFPKSDCAFLHFSIPCPNLICPPFQGEEARARTRGPVEEARRLVAHQCKKGRHQLRHLQPLGLQLNLLEFRNFSVIRCRPVSSTFFSS